MTNTKQAVTTTKKRWPRGTWMTLISTETLTALMNQKDFNGSRLARYAGCSRQFISHLRLGRKNTCTPVLAARIAEALDVPLSVLFVPTVPLIEHKIRNRQRAA